MPRSRPKVYARNRHKKVLKSTKGQFGGRSRLFRTAKRGAAAFAALRLSRPAHPEARFPSSVDHAHQCRDPHARHELRPVHPHGLKLAEVEIDRKVLADMAVHDEAGFAALVDVARAQLA